jgi:hypothetical protein
VGRAFVWKPSEPAFRKARAVHLNERPLVVAVGVANIGNGAINGIGAEKRKHFFGVCDYS